MRRFAAILFWFFVSLGRWPASAAGREMVLDGRFDDWAGIEPVADVDPMDSGHTGATTRGENLRPGRVWVTHDADYLYLRFQTQAICNPQSLDGSLQVLFDLDDDPRSGRHLEGLGVDFVYWFTRVKDGQAQPGEGGSILQRETERFIGHTQLDSVRMPTAAAQESEWRIARRRGRPSGQAGFFERGRFAARLVALDLQGRTISRTSVFRYELTPAPTVPAKPTSTSRPTPSCVRVATYNVLKDGLVQRQEVFGRILRAIDPDIIGFNELNVPAEEAAAVMDKLRPLPGGRRWCGARDSDNVIVARWPVEKLAVSVNEKVRSDGKGLRLLCAAVRPPGGPEWVIVGVHLSCCGRIGDEKDASRMAEAREVASAIRQIRSGESRPTVARGSPIVVLGDLNLVGSDLPLLALTHGAPAGQPSDWDDTPLSDAQPLQLGGRTSFTWRQDNQPFGPGRLDFIIYSDSVLRLAHGFVLNCQALGEPQLRSLGLLADDTNTASDHLPVVADFEQSVTTPQRDIDPHKF